MIKNEFPDGRSVVSLIPHKGHQVLRVTLPFMVDVTKPEAARDLALRQARANGIDVSDFEAA